MLELTDVPVIDHHCHSIVYGHALLDLPGWLGHFTESAAPAMRHRHAATTLAFRRTLRLLAAELGVEPAAEPEDDPQDDEKLARAVAAARNALGDAGLARRLLGGAGAAAFFVDDGYPTAPHFSDAELAEAGGAAVARITRLEPIMERVIPEAADPGEARERLLARLDGLGAETVGLKSAIAYRTGLAVAADHPADEVAASFARARRDAAEHGGRLRLEHRPIHEHLLHAALRWAAERGMPVQFHTGYGDADLDIRLANPAHLRPLLHDPALAGLRVVLLHGCWPYTREGAFLAAVYEGVWLDLSYAIPFLSVSEMREMTRVALAAAPTSKLLYSSDGIGIPDLHWAGAHAARRVLAAVLADAVADGDLTYREAERVAEAILAGNARELYRNGQGSAPVRQSFGGGRAEAG